MYSPFAPGVFSGYKCIAQEEKGSLPKNEIVILAGPTYGVIKNQNISSDKYALNQGAAGVTAGINYNRYFNRYFGFGIGAEYNRIKNTTFYRGGGRSKDPCV